MKYYYSPGSSALAAHIALAEAGFEPELVQVDIMTRTIDRAGDYLAVNPKGYVPLLEIEDGVPLTETVAILDWIDQHTEGHDGAGGMERHRLLEMLAFLSTEVQKPFVFSFFLPGDEAVAMLRGMVGERFGLIAAEMTERYLLGPCFSVADALLYVTLRWARMIEMPVPDRLVSYMADVEARPGVQRALRDEGLS